jgi:hypothetical protein
VSGSLWLWYAPGIGDLPLIPLGVYPNPSPEPGVTSVPLGDSGVAKVLRAFTQFGKAVTNIVDVPFDLLEHLL